MDKAHAAIGGAVAARMPDYLFVMADYGMMPRPNCMTVHPARAAPEKTVSVQSLSAWRNRHGR